MKTRPCLLAAAAAAMILTPARGQQDPPPPPRIRRQVIDLDKAPMRPASDRPARPAADPDAPGRLQMAVLDFYERTPFGEMPGSLGRATAEMIRAELLRTGRYDVRGREELQDPLATARVESGALVSDQTALRIGRLAQVDYLLFGDIEKIQVERSPREGSVTARVTVNYRVLAVDAGRLWREKQVAAAAVGGRDDDPKNIADRAVLRTVTEFLSVPLPEPRGKVALVDPEKQQFVINLGEENGVTRGALFEVVRWGTEIRDPDTGEVIDREKQTICWGRVVDVSERAARLEAGEYAKSDIGIVKWKTRRQKLDEIRVGDTVAAVEGRRTR